MKPELRNYTAGELIRYAVEAVVVQGRPAMTSDSACAYITEDGCRCAIGHLLTEDEARHAQTHLDDGDGDWLWELDLGPLTNRDRTALQAAHDDAATGDGDFVPSFRALVGDELGLSERN